MYRRERDVYVVAVTRQNANAMLAFTFLEQLGVLFKSYFGTFSEASLKQNFVIIYELLDEILDNGFPQITAPAVLQSYITQKSIKSLLEGEGERAREGRVQLRRGPREAGGDAGHGRGAVAAAGRRVQEERGVSRHRRERLPVHIARGRGAPLERHGRDTDAVPAQRHARTQDRAERYPGHGRREPGEGGERAARGGGPSSGGDGDPPPRSPRVGPARVESRSSSRISSSISA